jgi:hypothetical protein
VSLVALGTRPESTLVYPLYHSMLVQSCRDHALCQGTPARWQLYTETSVVTQAQHQLLVSHYNACLISPSGEKKRWRLISSCEVDHDAGRAHNNLSVPTDRPRAHAYIFTHQQQITRTERKQIKQDHHTNTTSCAFPQYECRTFETNN